MTKFFCSICGEVAPPGFPHRCPPVWTVAHADDPDDTTEVRARDAQDAAETFAAYYDEGEFAYYGRKIDVIVTRDGQPAHTFTVECSVEPIYCARETLCAKEPTQ